MTYVSLYRKWRPQTFDEIAGQLHVTQTLKNAIERGRISHAYLFCGPRGTGKTTTARILAKAINCINGPTATPCNECDSCRSIVDGNSMDVLELDAASNRKVDEIRDFLEKIPYSSTQGGKKVYIVDEVHMLTTESFNTLLKTLEEPPEHVVFILATTEPNKVLPTILSRCQRFDFRRISVADIEKRLQTVASAEGLNIDDGALTLIAHHAQGALRDALGVLEQLASYAKERIEASDVTALLGVTDSEVLYNFTTLLASGDLAGGLLFLEERIANGQDTRQFIQDLLGYLRDLYLAQAVASMRPTGIPDELWDRFSEQANGVDPRSLLFYINTLNDIYNQSRWTTDVRLQFEIALFKMIKTGDNITLEGILHRIERLENMLMNGIPAAATGMTQAASVQKVAPRSSVAQEPARQAPAAQSSGQFGSRVSGAPAMSKTAQGGFSQTGRKTDQVDAGSAAGQEDVSEERVAPAIAAGDVDISTVQKFWPQVLKLIKEKKRARYNFFAAAHVDRIEDGRLVLALKESDKQFVESRENLQLLRNALKIASGIDIPIVCVLAGDGAKEGAKARVSAGEKSGVQSAAKSAVKTVAVTDSDAGSDDEVLAVGDYIKMVQDTFGAKIVEDISIKE